MDKGKYINDLTGSNAK